MALVSAQRSGVRAALVPGISRVGNSTTMWDMVPPSPDSVKKFPVFNGLREGCGAKILSALDLAAESSQQRSYRRIWGQFVHFVSHCGVCIPFSCSKFNSYCALDEGNFLHGGLGASRSGWDWEMQVLRLRLPHGRSSSAGPETRSAQDDKSLKALQVSHSCAMRLRMKWGHLALVKL